MKKLTANEIKKIKELRAEFPAQINVHIRRSEDNGFAAEITTFRGCFTQGDTLSELVEMVNDCVRTYFDIPVKFSSYMPTYLPPVKVAHNLDIFPAPQKDQQIKMLRISRETVRN